LVNPEPAKNVTMKNSQTSAIPINEPNVMSPFCEIQLKDEISLCLLVSIIFPQSSVSLNIDLYRYYLECCFLILILTEPYQNCNPV